MTIQMKKIGLGILAVTSSAILYMLIVGSSAGCTLAERNAFMRDALPPAPVVAADGTVQPPASMPEQPPMGEGLTTLLLALLPAAYYPILHRPIRKWLGRRVMNKSDD